MLNIKQYVLVCSYLFGPFSASTHPWYNFAQHSTEVWLMSLRQTGVDHHSLWPITKVMKRSKRTDTHPPKVRGFQ